MTCIPWIGCCLTAPPPVLPRHRSPSALADDPTLIGHLMAAAATTLDRCEAARRKKLPFFGNNAKLREIDRRQTLERVAAQRVALSAARVGLPQVRCAAVCASLPPPMARGWVLLEAARPGAARPLLQHPLTPAPTRATPPPQIILSSKIAPRALSAVNSPDPLCARHALALAALVARDSPALFIDNLTHLVQGNLDIFQATGALCARAAGRPARLLRQACAPAGRAWASWAAPVAGAAGRLAVGLRAGAAG